MPDTVTYEFINGWVDTGDLPCREALREMLPGRRIDLRDCPPLTSLHAGGEDRRVDFSTFRFTADLISRWAQCEIEAEAPVTAVLEAETCGSLRIWAAEKEVLCFEPFERNAAHRKRFELPLDSGTTKLTVRLEDLHERDTYCFRLTLVEGSGLSVRGAGEKVDRARAVMNSLRTDRMYYRQGGLHLVADAVPDEPVTVRLRPADLRSATMNVLADPATGEGKATITQAGKAELLIDTAELHSGCIGLNLTTEADGIEISRGLGATVFPDPAWIRGATLDDRRAEARRLIAAAGAVTPSRALVLLAEGRVTEAVPLMEPAFQAIENRHDCADFFMIVMLRIWRDHRDRLPGDVRSRLKRAILGFRYWLDEPGNDVMWFWSENHVLCFHVAQYIAGTLFPNDVFLNSQRTGAEQARLGAERLRRWFASAEEHGYAEWNSAAYYPIDFLGLLTLVDMAADPEIADRAHRQCDAIFSMVALHTLGGTPCGSQGRVYEKELFAGPATELGALAAVAFGGPFVQGFERAASLLAVSRYVLPDHLEPVLNVPAGSSLEAGYVQGLGANARLSLWKSDASLLSSVADHKTGAAGHQQHVVDLMLAADPFARLWVNHPGDLKPWGGSRPSLWAGSAVVPRVAQAGNMAMMIFDLDRQGHPIGFTHAMVPHEILYEVEADGTGWIFARKGEGYAALWASTPPTCQKTGLYAGSEWRVNTRQAGWLVIAGAQSLDGSFDVFKEKAGSLAPSFDAGRCRLQAGEHLLDFDGGLFHRNAPQPFRHMTIHPQIRWDQGAYRPLGHRGAALSGVE
ncbi:hypothetical protein ACFQEX_26130 [Roseibium salinum]|uniref:hypothetical protein n=1 Tax=Roseibium salinum TaxID=1604349 RepID=UPI00360C471B